MNKTPLAEAEGWTDDDDDDDDGDDNGDDDGVGLRCYIAVLR